MRIHCPECSIELNLGSPKAGNYQPKCKHCGRKFRLKVTDDSPPRVGVGKIKTRTGSTTAATDSKPDVNSNATVDSQPAIDTTVDSVNPAAPIAGKSPASNTEAAVGATQTNRAAQTVSAPDATIESTVHHSGPNGATGKDSQRSSVSVRAGRSSGIRSGQSPNPANGVSDHAKPESGSGKPLSGGSRLGGYRLLRLLGRGAMGEVYEAKQISLDRPVALKTIRESLSGNAASLARFTREAYAAAQLSHHNVVQIYDFGEDSGKHFFSMEWVRGGPLSELVKQNGALEPRRAASYTLQAARGLSIAHANGMVHRDIKPANLLLTDEGIVKVADLGLVKIPDLPDPSDDAREASGGTTSALSAAASGTDMTMQGTAVGTPAYMAPEQASDAASVDHRADIYSLGCSLFFLLTGRPPFEGDQVSQVLDDHLHQPPPAASSINPQVPQSLETVIEKSMAKRIGDRYVTLSEMVSDLEQFLGMGGEAKFSPTQEQSDQWHQIAAAYAQTARTISPLVPALTVAAVGGLLTLLPVILGWRWIALGPIATATAVLTILVGLARSDASPVMDHLRRYLASLRGIDHAAAAAAALMIATVIVMTGMWPAALIGVPIGALVGAGVYGGLVRQSNGSSSEAVEQAQDFVRQLRMAGSDEDGVRDFCGRYGGKQWQGLYEAIFGYASLVRQRELLATDRSFHGRTSSNIRDAFCRWLKAKCETSDHRRDQSKLERIEKEGLRAEGMSESEASDRAYQMASALIDAARVSGGNSLVGGTPEDDAAAAIAAKRAKMLAMLADARSGKYRKPRDRYATIKFLLGGQTRLVFGLLLLCGFAVWGHSRGLFDSIGEIDVSGLATGQIDLDQFEVAASEIAAQAQANGEEQTRMLGASTSPWSLAIAGILLALSAFVSGWRMTPFALVATVVIIAGTSLGVPGLSEAIPAWMVAAAVGLVLYVPGVIWGEAPPE